MGTFVTAKECNCSRPCQEEKFDLRASYSNFPSQSVIKYWQNRLSESINYKNEQVKRAFETEKTSISGRNGEAKIPDSGMRIVSSAGLFFI